MKKLKTIRFNGVRSPSLHPVAQRIADALDPDKAEPVPGPISHPTATLRHERPVTAATNPEMLALVKRAGRRGASRRENLELIRPDGTVTIHRARGQTVVQLAKDRPALLRWMLDQPSTMTPEARRRALMALSAAKRGML